MKERRGMGAGVGRTDVHRRRSGRFLDPRTDTFLGEPYRRIARRRGKKRAIVAVGRSILVIIWALLSDHEAQFFDLGPDYYASRANSERKVRNHVRELRALGYTETLNPAA